jgi:high-affinity Fe2+/Pb2+ permease
MKQSKKNSIIESIFQTLIGLITSILIQLVLYPFLNIPVSFKQNLIITFIFFIVSIIRGYFVRRFFNNKKNN